MQTEGQYRVGLDFNPSGSRAVHDIKTKAAELIDLLAPIAAGEDERARLAAVAMTAIEGGAMWAVKAVTKPDRYLNGGDGSTPA